jgi:hypothetical protein
LEKLGFSAAMDYRIFKKIVKLDLKVMLTKLFQYIQNPSWIPVAGSREKSDTRNPGAIPLGMLKR